MALDIIDSPKSSFVVEKIEELLKSYNLIVLKNAGRLSLDTIKDLASYFEEDLELNVDWYISLTAPDKLMNLADKFLKSKKLIVTEYLYSILAKNVPFVLAKFQDDSATLLLNEKPGVFISNEQWKYFENLGAFEKHGDRMICLANDVPVAVPLLEMPEVEEIFAYNDLIKRLKNKKVYGISLSQEFKSELQNSGILFCKPFEADTFLFLNNDKNTMDKLSKEFFKALDNKMKPEIVRYAGFVISRDTRSIDIDGYLKREYGFDNFLEYNAVTLSKKHYKISQKELIQFLIDQRGKTNPRDLFFVASTGSGKSLVYMLAAKVLYELNKSLTIVISPLKSLMEDQVYNLKRRFDEDSVAFINSSLSIEEKTEILSKVNSGQIYLLYISPETFVSHSFDSLIGSRQVGLFVVDEAHLVSSWGKTFRVDYGYLGDELKKLRKLQVFPVMATTATAIWSGELGTIDEISEMLGLKEPQIVFTDVKRSNIDIVIEKFQNDSSSKDSISTQKLEHTSEEILKLVEEKEKTIVYFPFVNHVKQVMGYLDAFPKIRRFVREYTGKTDDIERNKTYKSLRNGRVPVILATKAFGMGVDIHDIRKVFHHCVPPDLSEYVQEIGRAGRDGKKSIAYTYYHPVDPSNGLKLSKLSLPRKWQLKHVMEHIWNLVQIHSDGDIVISLDDLKFLFSTKADESPDQLKNKTRIAMFLVQKELERMAGRPVLIRKNEMYRYLYFSVEDEVGDLLLESFPEIRKVSRKTSRKDKTGTYTSIGSIYSVDIIELWKRCFPEKNIEQLIWLFFNKPAEVFGKRVYPRIKIDVSTNQNVETIERIFGSLLDLLERLTLKVTKQVTMEDFETLIKNTVNEYADFATIKDAKEKIRSIILNYFTGNKRNRKGKLFEISGELINTKIKGLRSNLIRVKSEWTTNFEQILETCSSKCVDYRSPNSGSTGTLFKVLSVMDILGLAIVSYSGGESSAIHFKCVNRTFLLRNKNLPFHILNEIHRKIDRNHEIAKVFYTADMSNKERWDFIENYYLGLQY
ncbi:hypothetical protein AT15_00040 [Kosmotoga arenicorallina S304]|uniref:ATP-dependent DNA helicase RecQ n=1 Tax=Kosmotoga arenicorallina S304 TaxID=1453497 RepID=A0A182C860_9BACT|nr:DEAD/DEAH box helicase [Kosmotoga arenicorallina]OAA32503.1 hypothetical protein AT15_00040 [Kosmotoga arenicorallina S304]